MGYGGTSYSTVSVDIVQADVQAIVDGITGYYGRTLTDVDNDLGNYLYYNGNTAAALLQYILYQMQSMGGSNIENYLNGNWYGVLYDGTSAVSYLNWIAGNTGGIESLLSGSWGGPLTDAAGNLSSINNNTGSLQGYLAGWNGGPLTDIASNTNSTANNTSSIAYYLYDYNSYQSAASLLYDIRNLLQQLSFDGSGRLRVNTTA